MRRLALLACVTACGRFRFGELADGGGDSNGDAEPVCSAAFQICDGFEGPLDGATWTADTNITIDSVHAHRGSQSLHVHIDAFAAGTPSYHRLRETNTLSDTEMWARGWYWLSALPSGTNRMELVAALQTTGPDGDYFMVASDGSRLYSQFSGSSRILAVVPAGSWFCVVWHLVRSTTATGSLDSTGDITGTLPNVITDGTPAVAELVLGIGFSSANVTSAQSGLDLWIDDVIVHSAPVTCAD